MTDYGSTLAYTRAADRVDKFRMGPRDAPLTPEVLDDMMTLIGLVDAALYDKKQQTVTVDDRGLKTALNAVWLKLYEAKIRDAARAAQQGDDAS